MIKNALVVAIATLARTASADPSNERLAPNSLYAEGFGPALTYSFNYERLVTDDVGIRVGFGYDSLGGVCGLKETYSREGCAFIHGAPNGQNSPSAELVIVPLTASYVAIRARRHALELGGGVSLAYAYDTGSTRSTSAIGAFSSVFVGYRYHPVGNAGFQFRIGAIVMAGNGMGFGLTEHADSFGFLPWAYLSLGASF